MGLLDALPAVFPPPLAPYHGQCRFQYVSTTVCRLTRYGGLFLMVGGLPRIIPSAGVDLANTGLTAATLYYAYAYMSAGAVALEASATGHSTDVTTGVEIKTGDPSRTLVGMVYMDAGTPGTFADAAAKRFTASWFNRPPRGTFNTFTDNRTTTSATFVELNSEIRNEFVIWADEVAVIMTSGSFASAASSSAGSSIGIDGATQETGIGSTLSQSVAAVGGIATCFTKTGLSEGHHYATIIGLSSDGTSTQTWLSDGITGRKVALSVRIGL